MEILSLSQVAERTGIDVAVVRGVAIGLGVEMTTVGPSYVISETDGARIAKVVERHLSEKGDQLIRRPGRKKAAAEPAPA